MLTSLATVLVVALGAYVAWTVLRVVLPTVVMVLVAVAAVRLLRRR